MVYSIATNLPTCFIVCKEEFEDTELAIRNSISEKVWQHTGQKKKDKQRSMKHYLGSKASCKQSFVLYYHMLYIRKTTTSRKKINITLKNDSKFDLIFFLFYRTIEIMEGRVLVHLVGGLEVDLLGIIFPLAVTEAEGNLHKPQAEEDQFHNMSIRFQGGNPKLLLNSEIADSIATLKSHLQDLTPEGAQVLIRGNNSNQATFYPQENAGIQTM